MISAIDPILRTCIAVQVKRLMAEGPSCVTSSKYADTINIAIDAPLHPESCYYPRGRVQLATKVGMTLQQQDF